MRPIIKLTDIQLGEIRIVIPKIREIFKAMGDVIIVFDNGDRRSIHTDNPSELVEELMDRIDEFYGK